ncbi:MAG TPA: TRAP transporter large permease subunit [Vicinamibacteria bacterium]|nr:TRAP transporter large permease subunit [Vicinamibacteria bacterium]
MTSTAAPTRAERHPVGTRVENALATTVLAVMTVLPLAEILGRRLGGGVPGSAPLVQHMTLWATFLGGALAARSDRLLAVSLTRFLPERWARGAHVLTSFLATAITSLLCLASVDLVRLDREYEEIVAWGIPLWVFSMVMPLGFAAIAGRLVWKASESWRGRAVAALGLLVPLAFLVLDTLPSAPFLAPLSFAILVGTALGMPIFTAIGGLAMLLFWVDGTPISAVPGETYRLSTSAALPAIPLFTLGGYLLAGGGSSRRLMRLFTALFGWMPGGIAVVSVVVLAFFTPLTGASGVTILSMGGLLLPVLVKARYPEDTSVGLVTVSGSIGLLLPPSLPVILYAFYAELMIEELFVGGFVPGLLLIAVVAGWGAFRGVRSGSERTPFSGREAGSAMWKAKWELLLPVILLGGIFAGLTTLVEAAALIVVYAILVECLVFRDLSIRRDLPRLFVESATLVGGFMIILGVALGLTSYFILAEVPMHLLSWVRLHIESPVLFLLALNVLLIVAGALMDIYSAILVIVPLITPMAAIYGIDPVHLGIIFLANMELGYLMPPMGENLFLAAYRFDRPLTRIYRSTLPFVVILLVAVLLITYFPGLTLWLVEWWRA